MNLRDDGQQVRSGEGAPRIVLCNQRPAVLIFRDELHQLLQPKIGRQSELPLVGPGWRESQIFYVPLVQDISRTSSEMS